MRAILWPLVGSRACSGRRATAKPAEGVAWMPGRDGRVDITDKDPRLKAIHDWLDEWYASYNDAEIGLD